MYPDDIASSLAPVVLTGFDQNENSTGVDCSQPPSHGDMAYGQGNSYIQLQTDEIADDNKAPSLTDMRHGEGDSYNMDPNISNGFGGDEGNVSGTGGQPVSLGDMVKQKIHVSDPSGGGDGSCIEVKAPSYGEVVRQGSSDTGPSPAAGFDDLDAEKLEGVSMVSNAFRKFRPNAYYRKEDDLY
ncbi:hypothetical protein R6Q57_013094 [Mikania cordata]